MTKLRYLPAALLGGVPAFAIIWLYYGEHFGAVSYLMGVVAGYYAAKFGGD